MDYKTTLIATLGGQPQKVTFLFDLLLEREEVIDQLIVVYISGYQRTQNALKRLSAEFVDGKYRNQPCELTLMPLHSGRSDLPDIRTPEDVEVVRQNINQLLVKLKKDQTRLHIGLSGGRRLISMVTLAAAMQYLTPIDHLWHINASNEILENSRDGKIMHLTPGSEIHLLPVPFVPWVSYFPGLADLLHRSPQEVSETSKGWLDEKEREKCQDVWESLTRRQQDVLNALASGLSRQGVASHLFITVATVDSHRDKIIERCKSVWAEQDGIEINMKFLEHKFGPFLAGHI